MSIINRIGAIVVNPKTGEPFFCSSEMREDLNWPTNAYAIRDFDGALHGKGYFETRKNSEHYFPAKETGYPRIHTTDGVKKKGVGNGTCLYVAGACAVAVVEFREEEYLPLDLWNFTTGVDWDDRRNGISSADDRSVDASKWWRSATKAGLAIEQKVPVETKETINDCVYGQDAYEIINSYFDVTIPGSNKDNISVCASGTYYVEADAIVNVLPYERAVKHNLVIATFLDPIEWATIDNQYEPSSVLLPKRIRFATFNAAAARAVNVGVFREFDDPRAALVLYASICIAGGMNELDIELLRERFEDGFDIETEAVMGIDDPRKNPTPYTRTDPSAGLVKSYVPARRKNPSPRNGSPINSAVLDRAERLAEERRRLGWHRFANLP
jgi:hypothetical protein